MRRFAIAILGLVACGGSPAPAPAASDDGSLLAPYLAIGDKLAADSTEGVAELGERVAAAAAKHQGEPGVDLLAAGAAKLAGADLEAARAAYEPMSRGMIASMRADAASQKGHWIVHCPMTMGGKGADWVQRAGSIKNVYEGSRMLQCGEKVDW